MKIRVKMRIKYLTPRHPSELKIGDIFFMCASFVKGKTSHICCPDTKDEIRGVYSVAHDPRPYINCKPGDYTYIAYECDTNGQHLSDGHKITFNAASFAENEVVTLVANKIEIIEKVSEEIDDCYQPTPQDSSYSGGKLWETADPNASKRAKIATLTNYLSLVHFSNQPQ